MNKNVNVSVNNRSFPANFLWGGATAANQLEGGFDAGARG